MKIEFCITVDPISVIVLVCGIVILYSIKIGYAWYKRKMDIQKEQGQRIY